VTSGRLALVVFLLSAAVLAFEVLLLRLFAIQYFHHFAYMAIGMAMLGFGASGTFLTLMRTRVEGREVPLLQVLAALFVVAVLVTPRLAQEIAFEPTQILWDVREARALILLYGTLTVPFLLGAAALAVGLLAAGEDGLGRIYAASLVGAGAGAGLALLLLTLLPVERALAGTAVVAGAGAAVALAPVRRPAASGFRFLYGLLALLLPALGVLAVVSPPWSVNVSPFKGLPQVESFAGAQRVGEASGPLGWVVAVEAPPFHHAPGLSLAFSGTLPRQVALFLDGSIVGAATPGPLVGARDDLAFLDWLPSSIPFLLFPPQQVLVLGAAGGTEVPVALRAGAEAVVAVELNPLLLELQERILGQDRNPFGDPRVTVHVGDARAFLSRTPRRFGVVTLAPLGGFGAAAAGVYGAGEDYLNTVEAYRSYLRVLAPGGVLAVSRWVRNPPRDMVKAIFTADEALRAEGVAEVGRALALVRSWSTATLLVKPDGFEAEDLRRLAALAGERMFDLDWPPPGLLPDDVLSPRAFHLLDDPVFRGAAASAAAGPERARAFAEAYPFNVAAATDDRPYFGRFLRLRSLPVLLREERGGWLPFAEWGSFAVVATLVQSTVMALLLILLPGLWIGVRRIFRGRKVQGATVPLGSSTVYFGAIGLAYLLVEIAAIQKLILVLGHPVYAASAVLGTFLLLSGVGSVASERLAPSRVLPACLLAAAGALVLALILPLAGVTMGLPGPIRTILALVLLAPVAGVMGVLFPLGVRLLGGKSGLPWAWAVNGFASVVAVSLAAFLAMEAGSRAVLLLGAGCYVLAGVAGWTALHRARITRPLRPGHDNCST
jgi:SAM-dependent methyltransferase